MSDVNELHVYITDLPFGSEDLTFFVNQPPEKIALVGARLLALPSIHNSKIIVNRPSVQEPTLQSLVGIYVKEWCDVATAFGQIAVTLTRHFGISWSDAFIHRGILDDTPLRLDVYTAYFPASVPQLTSLDRELNELLTRLGDTG